MDHEAPDRGSVTLQTHSFDDHEVERLKEALLEGFDIVATMRANKGRSILYIGKQQLPRFESIVRPFILEDLEYKLVPRRGLTP